MYTLVVGFGSEAPSSWKFLFSPPLENRLTRCIEYGYILFLEHYGTVCVTDVSNTNECVGKIWHDLSRCMEVCCQFLIGRIAFAADFATCPFSVPTLIVAALVSSGPCGAFGAM